MNGPRPSIPTVGVASSTSDAREVRRLGYSPAEAAESLGVSRDLFDERVLPELRVVRLGRRIVIPVRELERYLERNAARPLEAELGASR